MKGMLFARRLGAGVAVAVLGAGLAGGVASAGGGQHGGTAHGTGVYNQIVVTFVPASSPVTLPAGCWLTAKDAFMAVTGNAQFHGHPNKNGFWATTTFTGTASVFPILFKTGVPEKVTPTTPTSSTLVTTKTPALASGHLTVWDGVSINRSTAVEHATLTFKGKLATGAPVSMSGHFHFTWTHVVYTTTGMITFTKSTLASISVTTLTC